MFDSTAQRVHTAKTHNTALLRILVRKKVTCCNLLIIVSTFTPLASRHLSRLPL